MGPLEEIPRESQLPVSKTGFTSTIPIEIPLSGGVFAVDLNNVFITSPRPQDLLERAESDGLPHNICSWIKGIYGVVLTNSVKNVIAVMGGDCSNTIALSEILSRRGIRILSFEYPYDRDYNKLRKQFESLISVFNTDWVEVNRVYENLNEIRTLLQYIDKLTYEGCLISGYENHCLLVSSSDFEGDPQKYKNKLIDRINHTKVEKAIRKSIRIGYLGVPPIFEDLYQTIESMDAMVVFNEIQRQFSLPYADSDIVRAYLRYTYPYGIEARLKDIREQAQIRAIDGFIHYVQNFCFRQMYDLILREELKLPILTLEGDSPGPLDKRALLRIEGFLELLRAQKKAWF